MSRASNGFVKLREAPSIPYPRMLFVKLQERGGGGGLQVEVLTRNDEADRAGPTCRWKKRANEQDHNDSGTEGKGNDCAVGPAMRRERVRSRARAGSPKWEGRQAAPQARKRRGRD